MSERIIVITLILALMSIIGIVFILDPFKRNTVEKQFLLGKQYLFEGDYENAIIAFNSILEVNLKYIPAYIGIGDAYIGLMTTCIDTGELDRLESIGEEAIHILNRGLEITQDEGIQQKIEEIIKEKLDQGIKDNLGGNIKEKLEEVMNLLQNLYEETTNEEIPQLVDVIKRMIEAEEKEEDIIAQEEEVVEEEEDYEIQWIDTTIETLIRHKLGKLQGSIKRSELDNIRILTICGNKLFDDENIVILDRFPYILQEDGTYVYRPSSTDAGYVVSGMTDTIKYPYIKDGHIKSLEDMKHFKNLSILTVAYQEALSDISGLKGANKLYQLDLDCNNIKDISVLASLTNLHYLSVQNNQIEDIKALESLSLDWVQVEWNHIRDFSAIQHIDQDENYKQKQLYHVVRQ